VVFLPQEMKGGYRIGLPIGAGTAVPSPLDFVHVRHRGEDPLGEFRRGCRVVTEIASLAASVGALLKERGQSVAVAESSSGGVIAAALLAVPGASAYFKGGGVVYTGASKQILMGLSDAAMADARAATEAHALRLAQAAKARLDADWGIGETGAAGPTGNRYGDPPGHSCIGVAGPICRAVTVETGLTDRAENMIAFAAAALELLAICLKESAPSESHR
jgi:nicotinamide-nucleotide amidase